jgi:hypothetical protein
LSPCGGFAATAGKTGPPFRKSRPEPMIEAMTVN